VDLVDSIGQIIALRSDETGAQDAINATKPPIHRVQCQSSHYVAHMIVHQFPLICGLASTTNAAPTPNSGQRPPQRSIRRVDSQPAGNSG
jgi:hypothetical protein